MSQADLLVNLFKTASSGNQTAFREVASQLIERERAKGHRVLAERLDKSLQKNSRSLPVVQSINNNTKNKKELFFEVIPERSFKELTFSYAIKEQVNELVEEQHKADILRAHNLKPRNKILLAGAPGNGKTSLAEAIAYELMVPLIVVRYDTLIGSYLGETAAKLNSLFEYVRNRRCVLFFDEFETLGKERGDTQETGEIKRVVSTLLLLIDDLPDFVITLAATNHPELLDKAVWRRFQLRLELPKPTREQLSHFIETISLRTQVDFGYAYETLAKKLLGQSFAEVEEFCLAVVRRAVLTNKTKNAKQLTQRKLEQWQQQLKPSQVQVS